MLSAGESSILKGGSITGQDRSKPEQSYPSQLGETMEQDQYQVLVRRADLDDIEPLMKLIKAEQKEAQDLLFDYPQLIKLFEQSHLSVTMLDSNSKIIGCAVFNDFPQGLTGMIDFQHENFWEYWIFNAFEFDEDVFVSPYNSLWLTYFFIAKEENNFQNHEELNVMEKVFQNVYSTLQQLEVILFLRRGESLGNDCADIEVNDILEQYFLQVKIKDKEILKKVRGIHSQSQLYYSPKQVCTEQMEIRMAREQDHDDLAEIFNKQSEVLTNQFGEFFIADLIATQNLTRRISKKFKSEGKAIVGQVRDKAVGLMSVSTEIDYKLLAACFELDTYDNLFKPEFMEAIRNRREDIIEEQKWKEYDIRREKLKRLEEEILKCNMIGQRISLQQHCFDKSDEINNRMEELLSTEDNQKTLTKEVVEKLIDEWMNNFKPHQPSNLFLEFPDVEPDIQCMILTPRQLLLETLEFFGLPKNYMLGVGHWKDWEKKKMEEKRAAQLRKPTKKPARNPKRKGKGEEKKEDEFKPPSWFDLTPFQSAFKKFVAVSSEQRSIFRKEIELNNKKIIMLFCNENGEMKDSRCVDLNELGATLLSKGIAVNPDVSENMANFLQCFGDIIFEEETIQFIPKEPENVGGKDAKAVAKPKDAPAVKKPGADPNEQAKPITKILKKTSYREFMNAINTYKKFDIMLRKLGITKSNILMKEVQQLVDEEAAREAKEKAQRKKVRPQTPFDEYIKNIIDVESIPEIPLQAQNAVVINLFCIDENYESRSLEFVEYAFNLFPDREYIILTQPYTVPETTLLQNFIQIPMKKNSTFEHVLYIYHKDSLSSNSIFVRKSKIEDVEEVEPLFANLINSKQLRDDTIEAIKNSASKKVAFSVFCDTQLIGIYVVSKSVNLDYYQSHFCIQDHIILNEHPRPYHTKLLHSVLNPLFSKSQRFILKEILRLMNKTSLYFEVNERTLLPDIFNELVFVRARTFPHFLKRKWDFEHDNEHYERAGDMAEVQDGERDPFDQEESPFSLSMITKKQLSNVKVSNNTRIVVVGASDTGISFIESLLTIKEVNFTHITLLAPGGLLTMHVTKPDNQLKAISTNYTLEELRNLMLDARVSVLDAKMVKLDKKNKKIKLDKNAFLPYDILVNAVGLIDTELQSYKQLQSNQQPQSNQPQQLQQQQQLIQQQQQQQQQQQIQQQQQGLVSAGLANSPYYLQTNKQIIAGVYSIDDPYLYEHFKITGKKDSNIDLLTRKKRPQNITIYGRTLHTIAFISGLLNRGVKPQRIHYVIPPRQFDVRKQFKTNKERLDYEDMCINNPDPFEDPRVEKKIFDILEGLGIKIYKGYDQMDIKTQDDAGKVCQQVIFKKKADNFDQINELIEKKKQENLERLQDSENQNKGFDDNMSKSDLDDDENHIISPEQEILQLESQLYDVITLNSRLLVTSGPVDIDKEIFYIIHENGLVYNGRLIVTSNFQTTESAIFCCGKICEFSLRYKNLSIGKSLRLDKYNGRELGQKLSKCILEHLDLSYLTDQLYGIDQLPQLYMPIGIGAFLPGKFYYYHIKKNEWAKPKITIEQANNRPPLISDNIKDNKGHYLCFNFDNNGLIDSVTYLGSEAVSVPSLVSFVGLSEKYLNKLDIRFKDGLIENVSEFLSENWAISLYHEWFSEFRHLTKCEMIQSDNIQEILEKISKHAREGGYIDPKYYEEIKKQIVPEIISAIQEGTLDFIRENQNHLPMYYVPPKKIQQE